MDAVLVDSRDLRRSLASSGASSAVSFHDHHYGRVVCGSFVCDGGSCFRCPILPVAPEWRRPSSSARRSIAEQTDARAFPDAVEPVNSFGSVRAPGGHSGSGGFQDLRGRGEIMNGRPRFRYEHALPSGEEECRSGGGDGPPRQLSLVSDEDSSVQLWSLSLPGSGPLTHLLSEQHRTRLSVKGAVLGRCRAGGRLPLYQQQSVAGDVQPPQRKRAGRPSRALASALPCGNTPSSPQT